MARSINDIDAMFVAASSRLPKTSGGRGRDSNTSFSFLLHPIHCRFAFVNLADFMRNAGIKKNPFGNGGFAGVNMSYDAYISVFF